MHARAPGILVKRVRWCAIAACLVCAPLNLAGCGGDSSRKDTAHDRSSTGSASTSASPAVGTSDSGAQTGTGGSTHPTTSGSHRAAGDACPASTDTLLAALRKDTDFNARAGKPTKLQDVACYDRYATTGASSGSTEMQGRILFGYDVDTKTWRPLNLGSGGYCEGHTSHEIASQLPGCDWSDSK